MNKRLPAQIKPGSENIGNLKRTDPDQSLINPTVVRDSETNVDMRLKEMEKINLQLENRVEQDTIKLNEVILRNSKFLNIIAHDLRNPFNSIIGILDILGDNIEDYTKEEIEKLIHVASSSAVNTYNLLENLLAWSVSQNKEKNFNPVKIDLHELIVSELEAFSPTALLKNISFENTTDAGLFVTADIQMVNTIFRNLISNALKYSNEGGCITIKATERKQFVEIEVNDNGIGMSNYRQRKLFKMEEFQSTLGTKNEPGTGMGLLFCKEFVELHGGRIWVESEINEGSSFKFTLPHYI